MCDNFPSLSEHAAVAITVKKVYTISVKLVDYYTHWGLALMAAGPNIAKLTFH